MTATEILSGLTQFEYERLLSRLAGAMNTQRRFITIVSADRVAENITEYRVKRQGAFNHSLIEEKRIGANVFYSHKGLII